MSTKKKPTTTANIPRIGVTDPSYPMGDNRRRMERGYGRPGGESGPRTDDPLEQIKFEQREELLKEYRDAKAERGQKKLELEIKKMKEESAIDTSGGALNIKGMYNFSAQELTAISQMSEDQQQAFYNTIQQIGMMAAMQPRGAGGQAMNNPLLAMMMSGGFNRQGQGLGLKDVVEIGNMYKTIFEGAGRGNQDTTNTLLLKLMTETVPGLQQQANTNLQMGYNAIIQSLQQNQSDPMRDLNYLKEGASALGYVPQNTSSEVAKLRLEMENTWKMKDWEQRREELKYRRNLGVVDKILETMQGMTKNVSREHMKGFFQNQPQPTAPAPAVPVQVAPTPQQAPVQGITHKVGPDQVAQTSKRLIQYQCQKCNSPMLAPEGVTPVTCAACGQVHTAPSG